MKIINLKTAKTISHSMVGTKSHSSHWHK